MGNPAEFAVVVEAAPVGRTLVRVTGELDMSTAGELERALAAIEGDQDVMLDLTECTFLDSAGVRAITTCIRGGRQVSLVVDDPGIRRILEITALDTLVEIHAGVDGP